MASLGPTIVLLSAGVLATAGIAPAFGQASPSVSCGSVITADTTLTADVVNCAGNGLTVDADNITLDLNGHTVSGDGVPAGHDDIHFDYGILVEGHHGVTVMNGSVDRFDRGVLFDASRGGVVTAMHVYDNSNRGIMFDNASDNARVLRNTPTDNGASGIAVVSSQGALVTGNQSARNYGGAGVKLEVAGGATVTRNRLIDNVFGVQVVDGSHDNRIDHNTVTGGEVGVIMEFSLRNVMTHNHISRSGAGFSLESSDDNLLTNNQVTHSVASACDGCGIGIQVYGNHNLVTRNTLIDSPRYGIEIDDFGDPGHSPVVGNVLRDNVVIHAGEGIAIGPEAGGVVLNTLAQHNVTIGAVDDGIQLIGPSTGLETSTLTRNIANQNGDLGIETVSGTNDGGGNRAAGNGNPLQCLNITCR